MATHSPYILYAINNAILANHVRRDLPPDVAETMDCAAAVFSGKDISVWQIKDGKIESAPGCEGQTTSYSAAAKYS